MTHATKTGPRILVVRRDNIGDLVCTTPLIAALRQRFPHAWIGVLANSYNAPVIAGNPDVDAIYAYTKLKHRASGQSGLGVLWRRLAMLWQLRHMKLDDVILATPSNQPRLVALARRLKPRRLIAFGDFDKRDGDARFPPNPPGDGKLHEVERVFQIASVYGINTPPPPCKVVLSAANKREHKRIAIHISARKPSQQWPAKHFVQLMRALLETDAALRFTLLWAPGTQDDALHPGDDGKARQILDELGAQFPIDPEPTTTLNELIAAIARCSTMICADGGAMHVGAGLGLPIVCLFGNSEVDRWHPWGVPYRILQAKSLDVRDIDVAQVVAAVANIADSASSG